MQLPQYLWLRLIAVAACIGAVVWINAPHPGEYGTIQGVSPLITSTTAQPPAYALHVLFIGNSFTFCHDIPRQVADIASHDPGNQTQFVIQSVTRGGIGLKELWDDGDAVKAIRGNHWDYVVIQQHSGWAIMEVENTYDYAARFDKVIKESGAKTLIYLTWVNKPGSHWYTDPGFSETRDPDYMLRKFIYHTYELAKMLGAQTVDVGIYWQRVLSEQPSVELYAGDAHHPSVAGSYLAALVFYKTLTGRDVTKIDFHPGDVAADDAQKIRAIVSRPLVSP